MCRRIRIPRVYLSISTLVIACSVLAIRAEGRDDAPEFKVGDEVEFESFGERRRGKVTDILGNGWPIDACSEDGLGQRCLASWAERPRMANGIVHGTVAAPLV